MSPHFTGEFSQPTTMTSPILLTPQQPVRPGSFPRTIGQCPNHHSIPGGGSGISRVRSGSGIELATRCGIVLVVMLLCSTGLGAGDQEEQQLLATLTSAGSSLHDKGVACRRLAVVGTPAAVPALARLLEDPSLAHFARIALEPMPFPEVNAALRDTMGRVQGRLLVGVVNTIGVRRDAGAIDAVEKLVTHDDAEVSDSAAAALGRIGTPDTARILERALGRAAPARRNSIADAGLSCGEELLAKSQFRAAVRLFDAIAEAEIARHIQLGATRGSILARRDQGASLLVEQLRSRDPDSVALGLKVSRELPGTKVTETLAKELPKLPAERQALLAAALGDRKDPAGRTAVLRATRSGAVEVRVASVSALVSLADPSVLPALLEAACDGRRRCGLDVTV